MKFVAAAVISFFFAGFCWLVVVGNTNYEKISLIFFDSNSFHFFFSTGSCVFFVQKGDGVCRCLETGIFNLLPNCKTTHLNLLVIEFDFYRLIV